MDKRWKLFLLVLLPLLSLLGYLFYLGIINVPVSPSSRAAHLEVAILAGGDEGGNIHAWTNLLTYWKIPYSLIDVAQVTIGKSTFFELGTPKYSLIVFLENAFKYLDDNGWYVIESYVNGSIPMFALERAPYYAYRYASRCSKQSFTLLFGVNGTDFNEQTDWISGTKYGDIYEVSDITKGLGATNVLLTTDGVYNWTYRIYQKNAGTKVLINTTDNFPCMTERFGMNFYWSFRSYISLVRVWNLYGRTYPFLLRIIGLKFNGLIYARPSYSYFNLRIDDVPWKRNWEDVEDSQSYWTSLINALKEYGAKATLFLILSGKTANGNWSGTRLVLLNETTKGQNAINFIKLGIKEGVFEVGLHGLTHNSYWNSTKGGYQTAAQMDEHTKTATILLKEWFGAKNVSRVFAAPYNYYNNDVEDIIVKYGYTVHSVFIRGQSATMQGFEGIYNSSLTYINSNNPDAPKNVEQSHFNVYVGGIAYIPLYHNRDSVSYLINELKAWNSTVSQYSSTNFSKHSDSMENLASIMRNYIYGWGITRILVNNDNTITFTLHVGSTFSGSRIVVNMSVPIDQVMIDGVQDFLFMAHEVVLTKTLSAGTHTIVVIFSNRSTISYIKEVSWKYVDRGMVLLSILNHCIGKSTKLILKGLQVRCCYRRKILNIIYDTLSRITVIAIAYNSYRWVSFAQKRL